MSENKILNNSAENISEINEKKPEENILAENNEQNNNNNNIVDFEIDPIIKEYGLEGLKNINDLIIKAKKQEKDKLYQEITKLKQQNSELSKQLSNFLSENKQVVHNKNENNLNIKENVDENNNDLLRKEIEQYKNTIKELKNELRNITNTVSKEINSIKLEKAKENILNKYPNAIPEYVFGNTEEELEAAAINSINIRNKIIDEYEKRKIEEVKNKPTIPPINTPQQDLIGNDGKTYTEKDIENMSDEEFKKLLKSGAFGDFSNIFNYKIFGQIS